MYSVEVLDVYLGEHSAASCIRLETVAAGLPSRDTAQHERSEAGRV